MIREVKIKDSADICEIYNYYVNNTIITFQEEPYSLNKMEEKIANAIKKFCWVVWEENNQVVGYAHSGEWDNKNAYRYSVETTIYLHPEKRNIGIGKKLYIALLTKLKEMGLNSALGLIALPNPQSRYLHEKLGFSKVAHFKNIGYKFNKWIDVGCWQLQLKDFNF